MLTFADVSQWQGAINWGAYPLPAVSIRAAYGGAGGDTQFAANQAGARAKGLPIWYYIFKYVNQGSPEQHAQNLINRVGSLRAGESYVLDDEDEAVVNYDFAARFIAEIRRLTGKSKVVLYTNEARFNGVNTAGLKSLGYEFWVANWGPNNGSDNGYRPSANGQVAVAKQFTSNALGRNYGMSSERLDLNTFYGDIDSFKTLTGSGGSVAPSANIEQLAQEVLAGKHGNGEARRQSLGANYDAVQARVNQILAGNSGGGSSTSTYTVVRGDTLSGIGDKVGVNWRTIAANNGIAAPYTIYPGQKLIIRGGSSSGVYTVVSGDTLSGIGDKVGVNWRTIAANNGIAAPYTIYPGQKLKV